MIKVISRHQDTQIYGAILPDELTNQEMLDSKAYKEYYDVGSGAETPKGKTKYKKKANEPVTPSSQECSCSKVARMHISSKSYVARVMSRTQLKGSSEQQQKDMVKDEEDLVTKKPEGFLDDKKGDQEQDKEDDLYKDVNINLERSDAEMTDAHANKETEGAHVTLTAVPPVVQQQSSSVSSDLVSKFINPSLDTCPKRQKFYGYATNMELSKDVYSRHMIIVVISLKIMQFFGYSHLEEIIVRRQDDQLYKFREGDFKRLRRQDIEDFYQKKINLKKPDIYHSDLKRMTPYTDYPDIQGIIYEDEMNINRLMRTDELHKFSDGTLNHVHTALNDIDQGIDMDYLPKRKWSKQDKQRARVMIKAIDRKLRDRRLIQNRRDLPRDILLDSVVVLRYEKRSKNENKGKVPTEMELVLEQTQQRTSYEVLVSAEGVKELKRKIKIKGEKKEASLTLRQKPGQYICCQESQKMIADIED
ncbi:hypothetical protein Tco_0551561 [Tanacetum coccineum]